MSSLTPDTVSLQAERARSRARRSQVLGYGAILLGALLFLGFIAQSLFVQKPATPVPQDETLPQKAQVINGVTSQFSGTDENGKPFQVDAVEGIQDRSNDSLMHLKTVNGTFVRKTGGDVKVSGDQAQYDITSKDLSLAGNVRFEEPGRYVAYVATAQVNLDHQRIVTHDPVRVETPTALVTADSMETSDDGKIVRMNGHVKAKFAVEIGHLEE